MRAQPFLIQLAQHYLPERAANLAKCAQLKGGWEGWLQVEIASLFLSNDWMQGCEREVPYPAPPNSDYRYLAYAAGVQNARQTNDYRSAARCDFVLERNSKERVDSTHFELKVIRPNTDNPLADAWGRFYADVDKIMALTKANPTINGIALLATYGTFTQADMGSEGLQFFWTGNRLSYAWDTKLGTVSRLDQVSMGGDPRLFVVATSIVLT
ncbi:hypothetical protein [Vogesella alkaliphila]|uniref:Uncharacterized protein n=1 Tax=Vogesella alkaliphila TaxID=1193621 RepID=A0ABQ2YG25_9NEIS|nr:hypothetical protein [Vogesella alkaliphila]GGX80977.1 hypothetical protein GCM10011290_05910 [Vogesella alkaliphila]